MMNESTDKQIWAVRTIIDFSENNYKEPEYTFKQKYGVLDTKKMVVVFKKS